jgi:hypothetical protein
MCYNETVNPLTETSSGMHGIRMKHMGWKNSPGQSAGAGLIPALVLVAGFCLLMAGCGDDGPVRPTTDPAWTPTLTPEYTHRAIWGVTSSLFFVAGHKGSLARYDDGTWTTWQFRYDEDLRGIWGIDANQVLAVGVKGKSYRFDGDEWTAVITPAVGDLMGLWGTAWDDAWAVGEWGTILHWDGDAWSSVASPTTSLLHSVWGTGPDDVFACGRDGVALHWDGADWSAMVTGTVNALDSIWGYAGDDVYAVGSLGTVLHWDGSTWSTETSDTSDRLWAVRGLPGQEPVALGARGTFLTREAGVWAAQEIAGGSDLYGLWDDGDSALLIAGYNGLVMRLTNPAWQVINQGHTHWLTGILAADCDRVVAVGKRGAVLISTGGGWVDIAPDVEDVDYSAVWGESPDDFFVVGNRGLIARYQTGRPWTLWRLQNEANLEGIWGSGPRDIYAVGAGGVIVHFDGVSWETVESGTTLSLSAVHGRGPSDIYAVGLGGSIVHFDGVVWKALASGVGTSLYGVYSRPEGETVVVGESGIILHSGPGQDGGTTWEPPPVYDTELSLSAVTGDARGNVYAVGNNGLILRYEGQQWTPVPTGYFDPLNAIHISPCGGLHAAGWWGMILEYSD